jgi:predicted DNA-binding antitoxin AbrB/MazE fold protein
MIRSIRTVEAVYEKGFLRPLEPIDAREGLHILVTIFEVRAGDEQRQSPGSLRGKYRGLLSTADEFSSRKRDEKDLEI